MDFCKQRIVSNFLELVKIDSESHSEAKLRDFLIVKLAKLGINSKVDKQGNLYAVLNGFKNKRSLLFSAHLDTVKDGKNINPVIENNIIKTDGKTILGADDKSGIVEILEALTVIKEKKLILKNDIELLFTVGEEIGLLGSKYLLEENYLKSKNGFVLDSSGAIGTLIYKAPSQYSIDIIIKGVSAHSGIEPEKGIHAIQTMAKAIAKLKLGRINKDTTSNIGIISGGKAINIVPDEAIAKGEIRSRNKFKLEKELARWQEIFSQITKQSKTKLDFKKNLEYNLFCLNKKDYLIKLFDVACQKSKLNLILQESNGGSDANIFNQIGIKCCVLSTGMQKVHTKQEFIIIDDMLKASELVFNLALNN